MPTNHGRFELTILGCSGGPISRTCAFLLKPAGVSYASALSGHEGKTEDPRIEDPRIEDNFVAFDAGSGMSALTDIISTGAQLERNYLIELYKPVESEYARCGFYQDLSNMELSHPLAALRESPLPPLQIAWKLINSLSGFYLSHSHLDHITGLIVNSPGFQSTKQVYALHNTVEALQRSAFNGSIWPDMVAAGLVGLNELKPYETNTEINSVFDITCYPVAHGSLGASRHFLSSGFLFTEKSSGQSTLVFGDLESDRSSQTDYNAKVWCDVAPLIVADTLNSIVIECSSFDRPPPLYGHLTPSHLIEELLVLRRECLQGKEPADSDSYTERQDQPLKGMNVIVIHVKETAENVNPRTLIYDKLRELNERYNLGVHFTIALPGLTYVL